MAAISCNDNIVSMNYRAVSSAESFINYIGLNQAVTDDAESEGLGSNRVVLTFCFSSIMACLKRAEWPSDPKVSTI